MITEDYVSFEIAKLLKEKGFNEPCHATYDTAVTGGKPKFSEYEVLNYFPYGMKNTDDKYGMVISAPTLQMAMKWLREVHKISIEVTSRGDIVYDNLKWDADIKCKHSFYPYVVTSDTYEETALEAIKYCLENLLW